MARLAPVSVGLTALSIIAVAVWVWVTPGKETQAPRVSVFAAASTAALMDDLATQFHGKTGIVVECSAASSGNLARQIEAGARADVFLSASGKWMDYLGDRGLLSDGSRRDLLGNALVLVAARGAGLETTLETDTDLPALFDGPLAVGDPAHVPAGAYAKQSLEYLHWYAALEPRLTRSASTSAAMLLVERGEAEVGIVYRSQVAVSDRVDLVAELPAQSHSPIRYPVALVAGAKPEAQAFLDWLDSPTAQAMMSAWRLEPLRDPVAYEVDTATVRAEAGAVREAVVLSLRVAGASVLLLIIPGLGLGWLLARKQFRGKALLSSLVHLPLVIPPVATGYLLLLLLGVNGPVGHWLHEILGLRLAFHWTGAAVASAVVALPLMVRSVRLAMSSVDVRLEAAARTLGSGRLQTFVTITLPLAWPGLLAGCVLAFARSLGEFGATITFAGNLAGQTRTLPLAAYSHMQTPGGENATMQLVMISVVLSTASVLAIEWLGDRFGQEREGGAT